MLAPGDRVMTSPRGGGVTLFDYPEDDYLPGKWSRPGDTSLVIAIIESVRGAPVTRWALLLSPLGLGWAWDLSRLETLS